jgi:hypothetical protein
MVSPSEKAVMLPVALLAGASILPVGLSWYVFGALVLGALGARWLAELVRGLVLFALFARVRRAGPGIGLAMTATGGFTLAAGVELHHRLGEPLGSALLLLAAVGAIVGAVLGPAQLRRALVRAGELDESATAVGVAARLSGLPQAPTRVP